MVTTDRKVLRSKDFKKCFARTPLKNRTRVYLKSVVFYNPLELGNCAASNRGEESPNTASMSKSGSRVAGNARPEQSERCEQKRSVLKRAESPNSKEFGLVPAKAGNETAKSLLLCKAVLRSIGECRLRSTATLILDK